MRTPNELVQNLVAVMTGLIIAIGAFLASVMVVNVLIKGEFVFPVVGTVAAVQLPLTILIGGAVAGLLWTGKGGRFKAAALLGPGLYLALPILLTVVVLGGGLAGLFGSLSVAIPMILGSVAGFYLGAGLKRRLEARGGNATQPTPTA